MPAELQMLVSMLGCFLIPLTTAVVVKIKFLGL